MMHAKSFRKETKPKTVERCSSGMEFTVDWYYFYHTDIFHDLIAGYKIKEDTF